MGDLVRIGSRLFNLNHVTSIEPDRDGNQFVVDVHIVAGRRVRLVGDDALAANLFVSTYAPLPADQAELDRMGQEDQAAQDLGPQQPRAFVDRADDTRG